MMRQIVHEGWLILRGRVGVSLALALALAVPLALGGFTVVAERWLMPLVAGHTQAAPVQVLLKPDATGKRRDAWVRRQAADHPEWTVRAVSSGELARRLALWFPYFERLMDAKSLDIMPPLVEIRSPDPAAVAGLAADPGVLAVGPTSDLNALLRRASRRLRWVLGSTAAVLLAAAALLAAVWVHLEMYRHADEITVMRLVGTAESAVRGPFLVVVTATGAAAGVLSCAMTWLLVRWSTGLLEMLRVPTPEVPWWLFGAQVVAAILLPAIAATVTLSRHATFGLEEV